MSENEMLDAMSLAMFGRKRSECLSNGVCVVCGKPAGAFSSHVTAEGWVITASCEACQYRALYELDNVAQ